LFKFLPFLQGQIVLPQLVTLLQLSLSDLSHYPLNKLTAFEWDPVIEHGIQMGLPRQHPSKLLTPILTDKLEDVLGHPLVPVVVWRELELYLVHLPQEDEDHSQFFR